MSSNNISESSVLEYVCFCFQQVWGIKMLNKDILKKAKQNKVQCSKALTETLFYLSILDMYEFQYTLYELGIKAGSDEESQLFIQQFILAYLSEAGCPLLQFQNNEEESWLDFGHSRILLLILGWCMIRTQFFNKIKSKLINKKFTELYIDKKYSRPTGSKDQRFRPKQMGAHSHGLDQKTESVQRLYRILTQVEFRNQCLQQKKSQIFKRLSKQVAVYNKKNQTSLKIENILIETSVDQQGMAKQQAYLEYILKEVIKGMKNHQYFWAWLENKVIDAEYKSYEGEIEKLEGQKQLKFAVWMNQNYLSMYNQKYNLLCRRMQELSEYISKIQQQLERVKTPKNWNAIQKEVKNDIEKLMGQGRNQQIERIGVPCFLKLQVLKHGEKYGYKKKAGKSKKTNQKDKEKSNRKGHRQNSQLKHQILQFLQKLEQIKFIL